MSKDLTNSAVDRQNILNNPYALAEIEKAAGIRGIPFEGKTVVLKDQVALFFEVTVRTVENYLEKNAEELARNEYEVVIGNRLKSLKLAIHELDVHETDFGNINHGPGPGWSCKLAVDEEGNYGQSICSRPAGPLAFFGRMKPNSAGVLFAGEVAA
jgi:hypothetical protein